MCATVHYGSQNFSGLRKKENVPNRSSVHLDLLLCSVEVYFKYVIHNYLYKMILPENDFTHLKGVNNQPYLDIRTSESHLTKIFLFSCISLFFLPSYVFYISPIDHFQVAFCLYQKESKCESIHMICSNRTQLSMSCSQEPLIYFKIEVPI